MSSLHGRLLVAEPLLPDGNFHRTVVFLLEHSDAGAMGVVLNRPSDLRAEDLVPDWREHFSAPAVVHVGGPVTPNGAIGLARAVDVPTSGWQPLIGDIGAVDLDAGPAAAPVGLRELRIFAGYAGWSAGQLEAELSAGGWIVVDADPNDPFSSRSADLWQDVLARQRDERRSLAFFPSDPADN